MKNPTPIATWHIEEVHGIWWAWHGRAWNEDRPHDDEFLTHHRANRKIIGPFHTRDFAERRVEEERKKKA